MLSRWPRLSRASRVFGTPGRFDVPLTKLYLCPCKRWLLRWDPLLLAGRRAGTWAGRRGKSRGEQNSVEDPGRVRGGGSRAG